MYRAEIISPVTSKLRSGNRDEVTINQRSYRFLEMRCHEIQYVISSLVTARFLRFQFGWCRRVHRSIDWFDIIKLDYYTHSRGSLDEHDAIIWLPVNIKTVYLFDYDNIIILMYYYLQYYLMTKRRRSRQIFTTFCSESTCFQLTIDRNKERLYYITDTESSRRNHRFLASVSLIPL